MTATTAVVLGWFPTEYIDDSLGLNSKVCIVILTVTKLIHILCRYTLYSASEAMSLLTLILTPSTPDCVTSEQTRFMLVLILFECLRSDPTFYLALTDHALVWLDANENTNNLPFTSDRISAHLSYLFHGDSTFAPCEFRQIMNLRFKRWFKPENTGRFSAYI